MQLVWMNNLGFTNDLIHFIEFKSKVHSTSKTKLMSCVIVTNYPRPRRRRLVSKCGGSPDQIQEPITILQLLNEIFWLIIRNLVHPYNYKLRVDLTFKRERVLFWRQFGKDFNKTQYQLHNSSEECPMKFFPSINLKQQSVFRCSVRSNTYQGSLHHPILDKHSTEGTQIT